MFTSVGDKCNLRNGLVVCKSHSYSLQGKEVVGP